MRLVLSECAVRKVFEVTSFLLDRLEIEGACPKWLLSNVFLKKDVKEWDITALTHALLNTTYKLLMSTTLKMSGQL